MLSTTRLFLLPSSPAMLHAAVEGDQATLSRLLGGVSIAEHWSHFPEALVWMRDYLQDAPQEAGWWNYLIIHRPDACLIGTCGFKGPPGPDGAVEIGYEIADAYQGRGLATEAAGALADWAARQPGVSAITAHTLAEENASVALLRRLGFQFEGEWVDLEDGRIWGWRKDVQGDVA
ncbi:MAG TPA: GNAT family N-acetyltransferase [Saprospiraceae bacterium]|nr:GNAT family N-acetyltransferase [Saprospiraceae bacterium]